MTYFRIGIDCRSNAGNASVFMAPAPATTLPVELIGAGVQWVALSSPLHVQSQMEWTSSWKTPGQSVVENMRALSGREFDQKGMF